MGIQNGLYRTGQFLLSAFQPILPWRVPELIQGNASLLKVPAHLKEHQLTNILVITTQGFVKRGTLEPFFEKLKTEGITYIVYDQVKPDPTIESIEEAVAIYLEHQCMGIVAIGGGSVLDCAKIVGARIVRPEKTVLQMTGLFKIMKKLPPLYAVPTTAGTGSEVTVAAVVTDAKTHYKYPVSDLNLIPAYAVLDPALTLGLPPDLTATTGMDAMTHAVEAYVNKFSQKSSDQYALNAVRLLFANLEKAFADGTDIEARANLLQGSMEAGLAFTRSYVGYVHGIAHGIGGLYGVPHGLANAMILPVVLESYGPSIHRQLAELAVAVGIKKDTYEDQATAFIQALRDMNHRMNIPDKFSVIREEDIPELVERADHEANPAYPVPVIWDKKQLEQVIRKLM